MSWLCLTLLAAAWLTVLQHLLVARLSRFLPVTCAPAAGKRTPASYHAVPHVPVDTGSYRLLEA